jgi:hypothetical protein
MRRSSLLVSLFAAVVMPAVLTSGCVVHHDSPHPVPPATCNVPGPVTYTSTFDLLHIQGDAVTAIASGDRAYAITSDGRGTYRLSWTDTAGYATCFSGRITAIDNFTPTQVTGLTRHETIQLIAPNQIGFASVPGTAVDGVDFFATRDPVYIDVFADNFANVNIYYTDGTTGIITNTIGPIAFASP